MLKIAIIDDHEALRAGIESILTSEMKCILSVSSLGELNKFNEDNIDVIILDLNLSNLLGAEVIGMTSQYAPNAKIVVYSMRDSVSSVSICYSAGALGFVSKLSKIDNLLDAIVTVSTGELYFEPGVAEQLASFAHTSRGSDPRLLLSKSELKVFLLLADGKDTELISNELNLSLKTIKNRTVEIKNKLKSPLNRFTQIANKFNLIT